MNRRDLLKTIGLASALPLSGIPGATSAFAHNTPPAAPEPGEAQKAWMKLKNGLFIHFGINTYYDKEWSDGTLDPSRVNPEKLDTDQWCSAAAEAGFKYVVLVTKHHDGFCNWPTRFTNYSIAATPFRKDIVAEVVQSAKKYGLAVGFYYSLWDRHEKTHDTDDWAYVEFMKNQLRELLTGYGPVVELWFDGFWKKQKSGWTKKEEMEKNDPDSVAQRNEKFISAWRTEGTFRWQMDHLYQFVKSLQKDCLVMNNSTTAYPGVPLHPVDIRSGEKATKLFNDQKVWNFMGQDVYLPVQIETTLSVKGDKLFPSGNWFWHDWDHSVATREMVLEWQRVAGLMEANLLINAGPMANGKLRPEDDQLLRSLKRQ